MGRPVTVKREGIDDVTFTGVIKGLRPDDLVQSAQQGDMTLVIPAEQWSGRAPKKFDKVLANGRMWTIQFVRECYEGPILCSYKAQIRG